MYEIIYSIYLIDLNIVLSSSNILKIKWTSGYKIYRILQQSELIMILKMKKQSMLKLNYPLNKGKGIPAKPKEPKEPKPPKPLKHSSYLDDQNEWYTV